MEAVKKFTRIIPTDGKITIAAQNGKTIISQSGHVFESWIDPAFKKFGLDQPSRPTKKTDSSVYAIIAYGTFLQIFKDIHPDLDKSVLTMSQIIDVCEKQVNQLCSDNFTTLFLTEKPCNFLRRIWRRLMKKIFNRQPVENYFVIRVDKDLDGLLVHVFCLETDSVWRCDGHDRIDRIVSPHIP